MKATLLAAETQRLARLAVTDPAQVAARLRRYGGLVRAAVLFRSCRRGSLVNAQGPVRVVADGDIRLGDRVQFVKGVIPTSLVAHRGAELRIGGGTILAPGALLEAARSVRIGERCMLAPQVSVCDVDADGAAPIVVGDDVWLAHGVIVEPGVTIGSGSVVSAGSVVRRDVPPRSLAAGNPATCAPLDAVDDDLRARRVSPRQG
jgi:maltose O-acetyltransferase